LKQAFSFIGKEHQVQMEGRMAEGVAVISNLSIEFDYFSINTKA
jgi:hypothetical protein